LASSNPLRKCRNSLSGWPPETGTSTMTPYLEHVGILSILLFSSLTPTAIDYNPNVSATIQQPSSVEQEKK